MSGPHVCEIEVRRHCPKDLVRKEMISAAGLDKGRLVGAQHMRGKGYGLIVVSPVPRTMQSAMAMIEGAGDVVLDEGTVRIMKLLGQATLADWIARSRGTGRLEVLEEADPDWVAAREVDLSAIYHEIVRLTPRGGRALVVTHTPPLELTIRALTGETIRGFKECEGVLLRAEGPNVRVIEELRLP